MDDTDCYESGFMSYLGYFVNQTETIEEDYAIIWESKMDKSEQTKKRSFGPWNVRS